MSGWGHSSRRARPVSGLNLSNRSSPGAPDLRGMAPGAGGAAVARHGRRRIHLRHVRENRAGLCSRGHRGFSARLSVGSLRLLHWPTSLRILPGLTGTAALQVYPHIQPPWRRCSWTRGMEFNRSRVQLSRSFVFLACESEAPLAYADSQPRGGLARSVHGRKRKRRRSRILRVLGCKSSARRGLIYLLSPGERGRTHPAYPDQDVHCQPASLYAAPRVYGNNC